MGLVERLTLSEHVGSFGGGFIPDGEGTCGEGAHRQIACQSSGRTMLL